MQPSDRVKNKNLDLLYSALHIYGEIEDAFVKFMNVSGLSIKYYKEIEKVDLGVAEIRSLLADTVSLIDTGREYLIALLTHIFDDARPSGVSYSAHKKDNFIPNRYLDSLTRMITAINDESVYPGYESQSPDWRRLLADLRRGTPPSLPRRDINKTLHSREASFEALDKVEDYLNRYDDIVKQLPDNGFGYTLIDPSNRGIAGSYNKRTIRNDIRQVKVMKRIMSENLVKLRQVLNNLPDAEEK